MKNQIDLLYCPMISEYASNMHGLSSKIHEMSHTEKTMRVTGSVLNRRCMFFREGPLCPLLKIWLPINLFWIFSCFFVLFVLFLTSLNKRMYGLLINDKRFCVYWKKSRSGSHMTTRLRWMREVNRLQIQFLPFYQGRSKVESRNHRKKRGDTEKPDD